jgi:hypothetical protein
MCRDCTKKREDHPNFAISDIQTSDVPLSTLHPTTEDDDQCAQSDTTEQNLVSSIQESTQDILPPCRYGLKCYRTKPEHFEHFSHPPGHISNLARRAIVDDKTSTSSLAADSRQETNSENISDRQKQEELRFIKLVEKHVQELIANLDLKDKEIEKLRKDQGKMAWYHQNLENALADELEFREKRELERQHILAIPRQTPSYWGPNAFPKSYHEIQLSNESREFGIINDLLNSTITTHGNNYGTICGKDPTEFLVTQIKRIENVRLWHEYCYKKVRLYHITKLYKSCKNFINQYSLEIMRITVFVILDNSTGSQPWWIKVFSDFHDTFSIYRAFNAKYFEKEIFKKAFVFTKIFSKHLRGKR